MVTRIALSFEHWQFITLEVGKWKLVAIDEKGCVRTSNLFISTYPLYNDILEYPVHFGSLQALVSIPVMVVFSLQFALSVSRSSHSDCIELPALMLLLFGGGKA